MNTSANETKNQEKKEEKINMEQLQNKPTTKKMEHLTRKRWDFIRQAVKDWTKRQERELNRPTKIEIKPEYLKITTTK